MRLSTAPRTVACLVFASATGWANRCRSIYRDLARLAVRTGLSNGNEVVRRTRHAHASSQWNRMVGEFRRAV